MYRIKLTAIRSQAGVTFLEALLQLLLFVVFCQLIGLIFVSVYQIGDAKSKRIEMDWEIAVTEMSQYLINVNVRAAETGRAIYFKNSSANDTLQINYLNNSLVFQKNTGVETLLSGVKEAKFHLINHELVLEVVLESGEKRSREFIVEPFVETLTE